MQSAHALFKQKFTIPFFHNAMQSNHSPATSRFILTPESRSFDNACIIISRMGRFDSDWTTIKAGDPRSFLFPLRSLSISRRLRGSPSLSTSQALTNSTTENARASQSRLSYTIRRSLGCVQLGTELCGRLTTGLSGSGAACSRCVFKELNSLKPNS